MMTLRHSNLSVTMKVYVKSVDADSVKAMKALEDSVRRIVRPGAAHLKGRGGEQ